MHNSEELRVAVVYCQSYWHYIETSVSEPRQRYITQCNYSHQPHCEAACRLWQVWNSLHLRVSRMYSHQVLNHVSIFWISFEVGGIIISSFKSSWEALWIIRGFLLTLYFSCDVICFNQITNAWFGYLGTWLEKQTRELIFVLIYELPDKFLVLNLHVIQTYRIKPLKTLNCDLRLSNATWKRIEDAAIPYVLQSLFISESSLISALRAIFIHYRNFDWYQWNL